MVWCSRERPIPRPLSCLELHRTVSKRSSRAVHEVGEVSQEDLTKVHNLLQTLLSKEITHLVFEQILILIALYYSLSLLVYPQIALLEITRLF